MKDTELPYGKLVGVNYLSGKVDSTKYGYLYKHSPKDFYRLDKAFILKQGSYGMLSIDPYIEPRVVCF